jgi:predicted RNA-binding Zn ribbon-like protein
VSVSAIGQAPDDLVVVQRFVNTLDIELATDELASSAALASWLEQEGLLDSTHASPAGPADLRLAIGLREALRGVLRAHAGHGTADESASELAGIAASLRARPEIGADGSVRLAPAGDGVRPALTRILLIAAAATSVGTWPRLKACSANDCQWAFYDRSPTRNACWCTMQICGSRSKSRAYRRRSATVTAAEPSGTTASRAGRTAAPGA